MRWPTSFQAFCAVLFKGTPPMCTDPLVRCSIPSMARINVVLPAPLSPINACTSLGATLRLQSKIPALGPKARDALCTWIMSGIFARERPHHTKPVKNLSVPVTPESPFKRHGHRDTAVDKRLDVVTGFLRSLGRVERRIGCAVHRKVMFLVYGITAGNNACRSGQGSMSNRFRIWFKRQSLKGSIGVPQHVQLTTEHIVPVLHGFRHCSGKGNIWG